MRLHSQITVAGFVAAASCFAAPLPEPLALTVRPSRASNVVFTLKNNGTNSIQLPSTGYVFSDSYFPANTNQAYAIFDHAHINVGLWLTRDWRHVGTNWMLASRERWRERMKIQNLKPGETLEVVRSLGPWMGLLQTNTNAVAYFHFDIPSEWADEYGLWRGSLYATGLTQEIPK